MTPAKDIATYLANNGIGTIGTTIFHGQAPDVASWTVLLINSGGPAPDPKFARDFIDLQVVITGAVDGYEAAEAKGLAIKNLILGMDSYTVGSIVYHSFLMRTNMTFVGYDKNNKPKFTQNWRFIADNGDVGNRQSL